jgi:glycosyltransferase involved in cell wall biosynthesis
MIKRLWIINHFATPPNAPGGTRHYDFGVELAKRGYKVSIFASDYNYMLRRHGTSRATSNLNDVEFAWIRSIPYKKNNWLRVINMMSFAVRVLIVGISREKPDMIIGSSPHLLAALSAYILSKIKESRFYLEIRDLWPQVLIDMGAATEKSLSVKLLRRIESLLYHKAERIVVLSEGSVDYITGRGVDPGKVVLIPNGVLLEQFRITESRESIRKKLGLSEKFVAMYTGAHGQANALEIIIDAGVYTPDDDVVFVLIGDGPCKAELQRKIEEKGLGNVKMLPAVPKSSVPNLLNIADALIITLRSVKLFSYGVSPNKIFEYMASGKPVICAVEGEVANMVTQANAGIVVEPENPKAILEAIISLMRDKRMCATYGENGRRFVGKNYSRSKMVEHLLLAINS